MFLSICMLIFIFMNCIICPLLLIRGKNHKHYRSDQFTSSGTWNYQGSYSNQHCCIIKRVKI